MLLLSRKAEGRRPSQYERLHATHPGEEEEYLVVDLFIDGLLDMIDFLFNGAVFIFTSQFR
jgi:hypothetical protein